MVRGRGWRPPPTLVVPRAGYVMSEEVVVDDSSVTSESNDFDRTCYAVAFLLLFPVVSLLPWRENWITWMKVDLIFMLLEGCKRPV